MKSVLIIGMGRFGRHLAHKMSELGNQVMIVDRSAEIIESLSDKFTDAIIGDCTNEAVIRALGVKSFDLCFVTIGEDFQSSLVVTSLLKQFGAKHVIAKSSQDIQADLLTKIGADEVVYPERSYAEELAVRYNSDNIFDYIQLTNDYSIFEVPILEKWVGKTIIEIDVRRVYGVNIIAVKNDTVVNPAPGGNYVFKKDDHIIVISKSADVFKIAPKL